MSYIITIGVGLLITAILCELITNKAAEIWNKIPNKEEIIKRQEEYDKEYPMDKAIGLIAGRMLNSVRKICVFIVAVFVLFLVGISILNTLNDLGVIVFKLSENIEHKVVVIGSYGVLISAGLYSLLRLISVSEPQEKQEE